MIDSSANTGLGIFQTLTTAGRIMIKMITNRGDIGEVLRQITHESDGVVLFKPFNIAIIGHPDMRKVFMSSEHTKGDVHVAIQNDIGPVLVSLSPGHPREEIRGALQQYLDAAHVTKYAPIIHKIIRERSQATTAHHTIGLGEFCDTLTLEVMYRSLFANFVMEHQDREIFADAIASTILTSFIRASAGKPIAYLVSLFKGGTRKREALFSQLDQLWNYYITLPADELRKDAFGQLVLAAQNGDITKEEARTQAIIIIAAGHETTSSALAWLLHQLAKSPDYQTQLRDEILEHTQPDTIDIQVLRTLPLLNQAIDEILRLYAPAWIVVRQLGQDEMINKTSLSKGTNVWMITTAAHRWAEHFDEPDRFLLTRDKTLYRRYTIPFGAGYGSCVGAPFARTEMQIVISTILRNFQLSLSPNTKDDLRPIYSTAIRIPNSAQIILESIT